MPDLDLNLLRVFDALMELRSVTRTAERLRLTQSAVSHALGRLRRTLGDPLFLRGPEGLQPTARAEEMAPAVRDGLLQLQGVFSRPLFDPGQATRGFTIAAGAYFCMLLVPLLIERIRREAPGVSLRILPVTETLGRLLDRGVVDLALGSSADLPARFVEEPLFDEAMVWIASADNPIATRPFDAGRIATQPRVVIAVNRPFEPPHGLAGDELHQRVLMSQSLEWPSSSPGQEVMIVYDSQTAVSVVARTDLVALVPERIAVRAQAHQPIRVLDTAEVGAPFRLSMLWHGRRRTDAGLAWLRTAIRRSAA